ncbi:uncharacterized protein LOC128231084 [Mya arenaria]|nr:uncharacterized protein LOC128231084 [Mya arenaria]
MNMSIYKYLWIVTLIKILKIAQSDHAVPLMLLKRGSGNTFSGLWNGDPFNAPALNLSYWSPTDLYSTGEFRMSIDSSWGPFEEFTVTGFNELDDPLAEIAFDVTGYDITNTSWLSAPVVYTEPVAEGLGAVNVFLS